MRKLGVVLLGATLLAVVTISQRWVNAAEKSSEATPVVISPVVSRAVSTDQVFVGTTEPLRTSVIGSAADGRVVEFLVKEGDEVKAKQPVAKLQTGTLEIELAIAEAELTLRREELAELKSGSRPEEIEQSQARLLAAEASMDYLKSKFERIDRLFKQNRTVTDDQMLEAQSAFKQAAQLHLEAAAAHKLAVTGPRQEKITQAQARVLMQSEQVRLIKDRLEKHTIRSPFDGYVTEEHSEMGEWVSEGDPIVSVVQLTEVYIRAHILDRQAAHLELGSEVAVDIPALPGEALVGTVAVIVPQADVQSRTFPVKIRLKNEITQSGPKLKSGMLARVLLPTGRTKQTPLVPKDALVLEEGEKPVIFLLDGRAVKAGAGTVKSVSVELGDSDGEWIQIKGTIGENQFVVIRGNERLRSGQEVEVTRILSDEESTR